MKRTLLALALSFWSVGCSAAMVLDPSVSAIEAGDFTLISSACETVPGRGVSVCHVKEGAPIASSWRLMLPVGDGFISGELTVWFKDVSKTYAIQNSLVDVPFVDLLGDTTWKREHDGEALALAQVRYKSPSGVIEIWKGRGLAIMIVTRPGYDVMPMDSGFIAWENSFKCKVQYSTAGRSAVSCK